MKQQSYEIKLMLDGDQWSALIGENLQEGICGFGDTPRDALLVLADDVAIVNQLI